jgi:hypothetical protein
MFDKLKYIKRYITKFNELKEFKTNVEQLFELKKLELLNIHSSQLHKSKEVELVHQINILAFILIQPQIAEDNISGTLRVYPNLIKS